MDSSQRPVRAGDHPHWIAFTTPEPRPFITGRPKREGGLMQRPLIATTQLRYPATEGRVFYERKLGEGKTKKEAIRALKRRLSDVVYRHLVSDQQTR